MKTVNLISDLKNGVIDIEKSSFLEITEKYNVTETSDIEMLLSYLRNEQIQTDVASDDSYEEQTDEILENAEKCDDDSCVNAVSHYIREAKKYPRLTCDEEIECAKQILDGDKNAKNLLICSNLWLPIYVAGKYAYDPSEYEDLIQEGNMALLHAAEVFDYTRGFRFSTYSMWHIQQHIKRFRAANRTIKVPVSLLLDYSKIKRVADRIVSETGRQASDSEIAEELGMSLHRVRQAIEQMSGNCVSLAAPVKGSDSGGKETTIGDLLPDENPKNNPLLTAISKELGDNVAFAISKLPLKGQQIIKMRYGLGGFEPHSYSEIANYCGITPQYVKKIEKDALAELRKPTNRRTIRDYMDYL